MSKRRYQELQPRTAVQLLPPSLNDYVAPDNPVRAIDAFVQTLALSEMGFGHAEAWSGSGQPPYDPAVLLKLYIYGYQNKIRSSRALEKATRCNVEVMWLCQGARPTYKTISDFRKNNLVALRNVNREFVQVCRDLSLIGGRRVAVDGTFLKASANGATVHTKSELAREISHLDSKIAAYFEALAEADDTDAEGDLSDPDLVAKMAALVARCEQKKALQERVLASGEKQLSEVDPDARLLSKRGKSVVGYNGQIAVDDEAKLIVAVDLVQDGNDTQQLAPMMTKAQEATGNKDLVGLADTGYANGEHLKACEEKGMAMYVPLPKQASHKGLDGRFGRDDFQYDKTTDTYVCPAGQKLTPSAGKHTHKGKRYLTYRLSAKVCGACPRKEHCLAPSKTYRLIRRWEHEAVMDRHRQRMAKGAGVMRQRGSLVEHPFGTLKCWAGINYFLMRGLAKCRGELNLMTLCYNFKRVLNEIGVGAFVAYCRARRELQGIRM